MPSILNATDKDPAQNAYCTAAYAIAYLQQFRDPANANSAAFLVLATANQEALIIWASAMLDQIMDWRGFKRSLTQGMRWPRSGVQTADFYWYDYDVTPAEVKQATAALAAELTLKNRINEPGLLGQGFSDLTIGPIKLKVDKTEILPLVPMYILAMLQYVGDVFGLGEGGTRTVRLVRA